MTAMKSAVWFFLAWAAAGLAPAAAEVTSLHHDMRVRLDPAGRDLAVSDRLRLRGGGQVIFRLAPRFVVTAFAVDGRKAEPARLGADWRIDLGADGEHDLFFEYLGRLAAMPKEPPRDSRSFEALAGPQGSYLPAASGWYPDTQTVTFTYRVAVEVPEPQKAVVAGRLVNETSTAGRYRAVFESESPATGLTLMAGPYVVRERRSDGLLLRAYFHPGIQSLAADYLQSTAEYIGFYRRWIGAYPYSAFHIVSSPLPVGLGFPGLTYMGEKVLGLPFIRFTSLGHEILHNWWGNGVRVDYAAGNWSEGLTTFMADYTFSQKTSAQKARRTRLNWLRDFAALPAERDRPVTAFVSKSHDAAQVIGYNKTAFFFHMLRRQLGAETFDAGIRRLWKENRFSTAGWNRLQDAFEAASGKDLAAFFDQWLKRTGAAKLQLGVVAVERLKGCFRTFLTLAQPLSVYALNVPIVITTASGEKRFHVRFDRPESRYRLETESRPLALAVDPDFDIFRRLDRAEAPPILRDVTLKADTVTIVLAADERGQRAGRGLAKRLLDLPPRFEDAFLFRPPPAPLLLIGTTAEVMAWLAKARLSGAPERLDGRGTARVWAGRHGGRWPLLVVAADDVPAIEALLRPLPHYGRKGYLVFEGDKAVEHGTWPATAGPLRVELE